MGRSLASFTSVEALQLTYDVTAVGRFCYIVVPECGCTRVYSLFSLRSFGELINKVAINVGRNFYRNITLVSLNT